MRPEIKILAISNVYARLMNFVKAGDVEEGHFHSYDHGTLLSKGKLLVQKYNDKMELADSKEFTAPSFIFIAKDKMHKLTSLEDDTVVTCIHALRDMNDTIVDPDFFVSETVIADSPEQDDPAKGVMSIGKHFEQKGMQYRALAQDVATK
jgi:hypothetical protein